MIIFAYFWKATNFMCSSLRIFANLNKHLANQYTIMKRTDDPTTYVLDSLDNALISLLRSDGRAPISQLAKALGVARGTVQNRLDRLLESGAILGFTLRVRQELEQDFVSAITLIEVAGKSTSQVIRTLRGIPELREIHTTNGAWDLIAEIRAENLQEFDRVLRDVRLIHGVMNSETCIRLSSVT